MCDRFVRCRERNIAVREVPGRLWVRVAGQPGTALTLLDVRGRVHPDRSPDGLGVRRGAEPPSGIYPPAKDDGLTS